MNTIKTSMTLALTAALGASGAAFADGSPFGMQVLDQGYMVAEAGAKARDGKCGEGKCGAKSETKAKDGTCGEGKGAGADTKAVDGKCAAAKDDAKK